jgi:hypothetical protein
MSLPDVLQIVKTLMNGIKSTGPIDPVAHADLFQEKIEVELDGEYFHNNGIGWVQLNGQDVILVQWVDDGVHFDDHTYHDDMLKIVRAALNTLNEIEERPDDDDTDDDMEWI